MRIPTYHNHDADRDDQSMTPMIDVVFLLLIFFVCASVGQIRESLLPTKLSAGMVESEEVVEHPKPLGEVWLHLRRIDDLRTVTQLNGREYRDFASLKAKLIELAQLAPEIPVILDIEPDVPLGDLVRVYDTCSAAEFQSINFAAEANKAAAPAQPRAAGT